MFGSRSKQIIALFCVIALAAAAGWYLLYSEVLRNATAAESAVSSGKAAAAAASEDESLQSFLAESSSTASTLLASVVPGDGSVPFIESVEQLAKKVNVGVTVNGVSLVPASGVAPSSVSFEDLALTLSIQGSWSDVYDFISMIESLPYKVDVSSISLNQSLYAAGPAGTPAGKSLESFWSGTISFSVLKIKVPNETAGQ